MPGRGALACVSTSGLIDWSSFRVNSTGAARPWEEYQYSVGWARRVQTDAFGSQDAQDQLAVPFARAGAPTRVAGAPRNGGW